MPSTPPERLPANAEFVRAYVNMPPSWQEVFDAQLLSLRHPSAWKNDENGITPEEAARDWGQLIARFYLSDVCQNIANCIVEAVEDGIEGANPDSVAILAALRTYDETFGPSGSNTFNVVSNPTIISSDCDYDLLYGFASQTVDYLHEIGLDILQAIDAQGQSIAGLLAEIGQYFPGLFAMSVFNDFMEWTTETLLANYNAAWTTTLRDELACSLFCYAVNNGCEVTMDTVREWISQESAIAMNPDSSLDVIWQQIVNFTTGETFIKSFFAGMIAMSWAGAVFWFMPSTRVMERALQTFTNDPNADWTTACDSCIPDIVTFDPGGMPYTVQRGTVQPAGNPGNALVQNQPDGSNQWWTEFTVTAPIDFTAIEYQGYYTYSAGGNSQSWLFIVYVDGVESYDSIPSVAEYQWITNTHLGASGVAGQTVNVRLAFGGAPNTSGDIRIDNIRFIP